MPAKKSEVLFLSATVHHHRFTEIRWMEDRHQFRVFSNLDFNVFAGVTTFESADTIYSMLLAVANTPEPSLNQPPEGSPQNPAATDAHDIPDLRKLSATQAQYVVLENEDGAVPSETQLAALDGLHFYHDAHCQRLAEAAAVRETARIAEKSQPKAEPPKPPPTVVNFWAGQRTKMRDWKQGEVKP